MFLLEGHNSSSFNTVCQQNFGRKVIYTNQKRITADNIVEELGKAMAYHNQNATEIEYLDRYYRGDAPIYYRNKEVRPEVNNKVHINLSMPLVETKASEMTGEPIQYVLRGTDEKKAQDTVLLNTILENEGKQEVDIELCRWRSICGTAYRYIGNDNGEGHLFDDTTFYISACDPRTTFVVYYATTKKPAYSVQIQRDKNNNEYYGIYTDSEWFITDGQGVMFKGINGDAQIPVIEYPNNGRRLSDIEITIAINDVIDTLASDRVNGIEQFVASWVKFVNCEIDEALFRKMRQEGALVVKSNNGSENKADVDVLSQELNQTEAQSVMDDLFSKFLVIQGLANRQSNTGGDTQGAVELRNGHYDAEKRAEINEPIFKKSERRFLQALLRRLRIDHVLELEPKDLEIKISRSKMDNMLVKAEVLQILLQGGIAPERAVKTVGLFNDPEQVYLESQKRFEVLYPESEQDQQKPNEVIEVEDV